MLQQDLQAMAALFDEGRYQEAALAIPTQLFTSQKSPPPLVIEVLAAAHREQEAIERVKTSEGSPDRAAVDALQVALRDANAREPIWNLQEVSEETLNYLYHWSRGKYLSEKFHFYLGGLSLRDVLMERYRRSKKAGDQVKAAEFAKNLCRWRQEPEWLEEAWSFTQEPLVLTRLLKAKPTIKTIEQAKALLDLEKYGGLEIIVPALLHAAGNLGDSELVEVLLAWPGLGWDEGETRQLFQSATQLIHALTYFVSHSVPEVKAETPGQQVRFNLLRAGALMSVGQHEQGRAIAEAALRSLAHSKTRDYDISGAEPLVYDLIPFKQSQEEIYIDDSDYLKAILLNFANDQQATPALQAMALLALEGQTQTETENQTCAAKDALEIAGNDPWIRLWAHSFLPSTGNDLTDLKQLIDDIEAIPAGERQGHCHYPNTDGWEAQAVKEALAYHQLLLNLPEQQDQANDLTQKWAFDIGQWRENLERFGLHAEAVEACRRRLALDPEIKEGQFFLAYHLLNLKSHEHLEEAERILSTYVEQFPKERAAWHNLAIASNQLLHYVRAAEAYEQVCALGGDERAGAWAKTARERSQAEQLAFGLGLIPISGASEELQDIGRAYWALSDDGWTYTVKSLAEQYGLSSSQVAKQARLGVEAVNLQRPCTGCGSLARYKSRSEVSAVLDKSTYTCQQCQRVKQEHEKKQLAQLHARRIQIVRKRFAYKHSPAVDIEKLTLRQATYLLALIRAQATEDFRTLLALNEYHTPNPLGASSSHSIAILRALFEARLIVPHPSSTVEAFQWQNENPESTFLGQARYTISGIGAEGFADMTSQLVRKLKGGPDHWPTFWQEELPVFWRELIQQEARAYLEFKLTQHNLKPKLGEKTEQTLRELSDDFSLGQIWNLVWQATQTAAATRQKDRISNDHAVNIATSTLRRRGEHYKAEGLGNPKPSRRDFDMPVPSVSQVLFVHGLGFTEQGYSETIPPINQ